MIKNNQERFITGVHLLLEKGIKKGQGVRFKVPSPRGGWEEITWENFLEHTTKIALYLSHIGIGVEKKIALFAKTRVEWAYCGAAIQACRGILVPVYHSNTPPQVGYILNHSDAEILMTELELLPHIFQIWNEIPLIKKVIIFDLDNNGILLNELEQFNRDHKGSLKMADIQEKVIPLKEVYQIGDSSKKENTSEFENFAKEVQRDDVSAILYTSGTTGNPKGVVLTNENLFTNAEDWINVLGPLIPEKRVDLLWLPTSHIFGWGELGLGNTLDFITYFTNPRDVLKWMPEVKPTIFMSVPSYWEKLYLQAKESSEEKEKQLEKLIELTGGELRFCLSGGAGLKKEVKEFFYQAGLLIIEGYGLTECSPTLTMNRKDDFDFDTVGKPFPRVRLKLAPDGEILAKGPNVFKSYYKDPAKTRDAFDRDGWFKTGDVGEWTERGFLKIKGRKKEIIVTSGGKNISPQLIESRLRDDSYIEYIVLYGNEKKYLVALITLKEEPVTTYAKRTDIPYRNYSDLVKNPAIHALVQKSIDHVNKDLASFETIKKFYIHDGHLSVEGGHITSSLKLKRNRIYETFRDNLEALYEE